jgi:hypothetical protein
VAEAENRAMDKPLDVKATLDSWKVSLLSKIEVGGLFSRNAVVHKWKAPWRSLTVREAVFWRLQDLLEQSYVLHSAGHTLGARILLRSAFETVAVLIYLNKLTADVLKGHLDFHEFGGKTLALLMGSRDKSTSVDAISILTVLKHANVRYPGLSDWYNALSEGAHPNCEGLLIGYSTDDPDAHVTTFTNRWQALYGATHARAIEACIVVFEAEYNEVWAEQFDALEAWVEANDAMLEATRTHP